MGQLRLISLGREPGRRAMVVTEEDNSRDGWVEAPQALAGLWVAGLWVALVGSIF